MDPEVLKRLTTYLAAYDDALAAVARVRETYRALANDRPLPTEVRAIVPSAGDTLLRLAHELTVREDEPFPSYYAEVFLESAVKLAAGRGYIRVAQRASAPTL